MKILEVNGFKYSREEFKGYKIRTIFNLRVNNDWRDDTKVHIYTDNTNREEVVRVVNSKTKDKVIEVILEHWTTKEQDEATSLFLDEFLKDI
jgi:hypothetical protein